MCMQMKLCEIQIVIKIKMWLVSGFKKQNQPIRSDCVKFKIVNKIIIKLT
jgi:hypothetical protein